MSTISARHSLSSRVYHGGRMASAAVVAAALAVWPAALAGGQNAPSSGTPPAGLKIVVLAGEDAVNVIQTKTAVAPVVEVRDRNDVPVSGAIVRFAIRTGRASFGGGVRTISVATDFGGRAVAAGLAPTGTGPLQIGVTASFQGQTAVATIAQMTVATAAQAAASGAATGAMAGTTAGGSAASGATAVGTAAAGGAVAGGVAAGGAAAGGTATGISAATAVVIGGAGVGGALATVKVVGASSRDDWWSAVFQGSFTVDTTERIEQNGRLTCTNQLSIMGTLTADLDGRLDGSVVDGHIDVSLVEVPVSTTCFAQRSSRSDSGTHDVNGTAGAIQFSRVVSGTAGPNGGGTASDTITFTGVLAGDTITGTLTLAKAASFPTAFGVVGESYSASVPVTLRKQ